jgi:Asp-tRNA(Asn)/Glu-tRNA(Gln) amidotransferase C subunit
VSEESTDRALGRVEGKIEAILSAQVDIIKQLSSLSNTPKEIEAMHKRLEKIEPVAEEFSRWRERGVGALMLLSFAAATFGAVITAAWQKVTAWLGWGG